MIYFHVFNHYMHVFDWLIDICLLACLLDFSIFHFIYFYVIPQQPISYTPYHTHHTCTPYGQPKRTNGWVRGPVPAIPRGRCHTKWVWVRFARFLVNLNLKVDNCHIVFEFLCPIFIWTFCHFPFIVHAHTYMHTYMYKHIHVCMYTHIVIPLETTHLL